MDHGISISLYGYLEFEPALLLLANTPTPEPDLISPTGLVGTVSESTQPAKVRFSLSLNSSEVSEASGSVLGWQEKVSGDFFKKWLGLILVGGGVIFLSLAGYFARKNDFWPL